MAFIRAKKIRGGVYHYLVESRRTEGKNKQETIACLGEHVTVKDAVEAWEKEAKEIEDQFLEFIKPFANYKVWHEALQSLLPDLSKLSDRELLQFHNLTARLGEMGNFLKQHDRSFERAMDARKRARKLRARVEKIRPYL